MDFKSASRRSFLISSAVAAVGASLSTKLIQAQASHLTARQLVEQMQLQLGADANYQSVRDRFKGGNPDTPVLGVACTFMSTLDVLQRAHKAGLNFVITHEPTIWSDADTVSDVANDPLYKYKMNFIESNGMVVWRIHDLWHKQQPGPMSKAESDLMGWTPIPSEALGYRQTYQLAPTELGIVGSQLSAKLHSRSVRIVGDPRLVLKTLAHGSHTLDGNISGLEKADAVLIGETRDWDSAEYVRDLSRSGQKKGMIVLSHEASEEAGMELFYRWFKTHYESVGIEFVPTSDRLWIL